MKFSAATAMLCILAASGCAETTGNYPSLAPRPVETQSDEAESPALPAPAPADSALNDRLESLIADARRGESAFAAALPAAERAVAGAKGATVGSENWVTAQQHLSALDAARTPTSTAMNTLDSLLIDIADKVVSDAKAGGIEETETAHRTVQTLYDRQAQTLSTLQAAIAQP